MYSSVHLWLRLLAIAQPRSSTSSSLLSHSLRSVNRLSKRQQKRQGRKKKKRKDGTKEKITKSPFIAYYNRLLKIVPATAWIYHASPLLEAIKCMSYHSPATEPEGLPKPASPLRDLRRLSVSYRSRAKVLPTTTHVVGVQIWVLQITDLLPTRDIDRCTGQATRNRDGDGDSG